MIDFGCFYRDIATGPLAHWLETLPAQLRTWRQINEQGHFPAWKKCVEHLPSLQPEHRDLLSGVSVDSTAISERQRQAIEKLLRGLIPWRKGPFSLYGTEIDTEWRSDWKWQRLLPHISPLSGRTILDVGCGNGYHMWRMFGAGARFVLGVDPVSLFFCQFEAVRKLLGYGLQRSDSHSHKQQIYFLPLGIEQLPASNTFDTVFSMGVLYHRRSPIDHIHQLKDQLANGGELVLETLVVDGDENTVLLPKGRYARMPNVWFIPSPIALVHWLVKCGLEDVRVVDCTDTTTEEQRRTAWMRSESLSECLAPIDPKITLEGYPAPKRALLVARKP